MANPAITLSVGVGGTMKCTVRFSGETILTAAHVAKLVEYLGVIHYSLTPVAERPEGETNGE